MCEGTIGVPHLPYFLDGPIHASAAPAADRPQRVRFIKSDGEELKRTSRRYTENAVRRKDRVMYTYTGAE